ncbi:DUF5949 family protein [Streptomyces sp. DH24]|uniref:DUF5949 family protein n=1 Tax=Streptomyces sp. DH24 TaxID=3040123 RepID=UPI002441197E|nr:DUF5949 family protein [Streptomyces sp. DH24]MDG9716771.1 DUF5949 family protein [Streptomyces sp. DH24]
MTSSTSATTPSRPADLGTLVVMAWSGEAPGGDMPYLLAYSLGDAPAGPKAASAAIRELLESNGLPVGGDLVVDGNARQDLPVGMVVESEQAVVTMPGFNARCSPPPQWLAAVEARGYAYCVFTTRPWPEAVPGKPLAPQALADFVGADETLNAAAHLVLPAGSPRG